MKIIGMDGNGDYIAVLSHSEIEKSAELYYGKLPKLKVGSEYQIGDGYDFRNDIKSACDSMTSAMKSFDKTRQAMTSFAAMIADLDNDKDEKA